MELFLTDVAKTLVTQVVPSYSAVSALYFGHTQMILNKTLPDCLANFIFDKAKIIRECSSTLCRVQHAVPPTNTKFKLLHVLLPTQAGILYTNIHKHRTSYFKSILTFLGQAKGWKSISVAQTKT